MAAKYQNFSRAARVLYVSQATVSKSMLLLEERLGINLFCRSEACVNLTPAGEALYCQWKKHYEGMLYAVEHALEIQEQSYCKLRVGDSSEIKGDLYFSPGLLDIRNRYPGTIFDYGQESLAFLVSDVLNGKYDLAFCSCFDKPAITRNKLHCKPILKNNLCIVVGKEHPLAARKSLSLRDLEGQDLIVVSQAFWEEYRESVGIVLQTAGLSWDNVQVTEKESINAAFIAVCAGEGALICDEKMYPSYNRYVHRFCLPEIEWDLLAVWDDKNHNPWIQVCVNALTYVCKNCPDQTDSD